MKTIVVSIQALIICSICHAAEAQGYPHEAPGSSAKLTRSTQRYWEQEQDGTTRAHRRAFRISLLSTLAPIASGALLIAARNGRLETGSVLLIGYGVLIGPAAGHFYLSNPKRAMSGLLIRSTGAAFIYSVTSALALSSGLCEYDCPSDAEIARSFWISFGLGGALITWSLIKGFSSLKDSAEELYGKPEKVGLWLGPGKDLKSFHIELTFSF